MAEIRRRRPRRGSGRSVIRDRVGGVLLWLISVISAAIIAGEALVITLAP